MKNNFKETSETPAADSISWTRVNNDVNGNPRYVCHFLNLVKDGEGKSIDECYSIALARAGKIGGRKFHNRQYGGGIVFQSYNLYQTEKDIRELMNSL